MDNETLESYRLCDVLGDYPNLTDELYLSDELDLSDILTTKTTAKMRLVDAIDANDKLADTAQVWILDYILKIEADLDEACFNDSPCESFDSLQAFNFDNRQSVILRGADSNRLHEASTGLEALSYICQSELFKFNDKDLPAIRLWAKQHKEWYDLCDNWQVSVVSAIGENHYGDNAYIELDDALDCLKFSLEPILFGSVDINCHDGSAQFLENELDASNTGFVFAARSELEACPNFYKGFGNYASFGFILTNLLGDEVDSCWGFYDYNLYWTMEIAKQVADNLPACLLDVAVSWEFND